MLGVYIKSLIVLGFITTIPESSAINSICPEEELTAVELSRENCINTAQERLLVQLKKEDNDESTQICTFLEEAVDICSNVYKTCYTQENLRLFKDTQIEVFSQLMRKVYKLGHLSDKCEIVLEYESSGRKDQVTASAKCDEDAVKELSSKYQTCSKKVIEEMKDNVRFGSRGSRGALQSHVCNAIDSVIHDCGDLLHQCYTEAEVNETKSGQLEIMKKIFDELLKGKGFDLDVCNAYGGAGTNLALSSADNIAQKSTTFVIGLFSFALVVLL